jgi:serine/threonine protein kinase
MTFESNVPGLTDFQLIGRGGSARVYRAYQSAMDRLVAVKIIDGTSDEIRRRFDRERKVMGRLSRHPGIVTILDSGFMSSGEPYLIMPYLEAGSLQARIDREGPLPWQEAVDITIEVAKAIDHGHQQGILHRDIKPGNILIDDQEKPQVTDFGIASLGAAGQGTTTRSVGFTPAFSPPEAFDAEPANEAADIYALAATFVCLVTGSPPFTTGPRGFRCAG